MVDSNINQNRYINVHLTDSYTFIKCLEFLSKNISNIIPINFNPNNITVNMKLVHDKKKSSDGYIIHGYLKYKSIDIPDYKIKEELPTSDIIVRDGSVNISFAIEDTVLTQNFNKTILKPSTNLTIYSKTKEKNLYYYKDHQKGEFTLKTVLGYSKEFLQIPQIVQGDLLIEYESIDSCTPNFSVTINDFNEMCGGIKKNENGTLNIRVDEYGARFISSDYVNPGKEVTYDFGILTTAIDKFSIEVKLLSKLSAQIDKFSHHNSIIHVYFGRIRKNPVITLLMKVGCSGSLIYQIQSIQ